MNFIRMKTLYRQRETGQTGESYVSLLPERLGITRYLPARFQSGKDHRTLFEAMTIIPAVRADTPEMQQLFDMEIGTWDTTEGELLTRLRRRLKEIVRASWVPSMTHVVLHSSGYDSRMLSWTIRELYRELGDEWLGRVLFLCSKWEGPSFKDIMRYEGWEPSQYQVVREHAPDTEYYAPRLTDFAGAWREHDGASAIPVNLFWYPVEEAQKDGLLPPTNIQLFTGQWGNTVMDAASGPKGGVGIREKQRVFYHSVLCMRPMKGDVVVHPYTNVEFARSIVSSSVRLGTDLRFKLCASMDETLARFENLSADGDRHRRIADWILKRMVTDYRESWYGKHVRPSVYPKWKTTEFQSFFACWTAASLCEHLLAQGHEIKVV